jgi:hypothetical protein
MDCRQPRGIVFDSVDVGDFAREIADGAPRVETALGTATPKTIDALRPHAGDLGRAGSPR